MRWGTAVYRLGGFGEGFGVEHVADGAVGGGGGVGGVVEEVGLG